ncbi:MAG: hypothetical protein KGY69_17505 [Bacteroidales bacterium]|nr:hypothetical protein [Bacteroidales bacterium]
MRCRIKLEKGKVKNFVIQYEISIQDEWFAVTRFDTYHDIVHRDLIAPNGAITKRWYLQLNFDEGLNFAYNDIENNGEKYREWYTSHMRK